MAEINMNIAEITSIFGELDVGNITCARWDRLK